MPHFTLLEVGEFEFYLIEGQREGKILGSSKEVALRAGRFLMENLGKSKGVIYKGSGPFNPVSGVDTGAERIIVDTVGSAFPEHNIVAEEKGGATQSALAPTAIPPVKS